jgi:hypothetical protein
MKQLIRQIYMYKYYHILIYFDKYEYLKAYTTAIHSPQFFCVRINAYNFCKKNSMYVIALSVQSKFIMEMPVSMFISEIIEIISDKFGVTLMVPVNFFLHSISKMSNLIFILYLFEGIF